MVYIIHVKLYGYKQGGDRKSSEKVFNLILSNEPKNQKELAESYGITQQTMNNYMRMAEMIPELEDLVDTGIAIPTTALAIMRNLSEKLKDHQLLCMWSYYIIIYRRNTHICPHSALMGAKSFPISENMNLEFYIMLYKV